MAKGSVFDKPYQDDRDKNNLEGVLEQFNLPPSIIVFFKTYKRLIQIGVATVIVVVVAWALYGSYRDNRTEKASQALSTAEELEGQPLIDALAEVADNYRGTDAALWATVARAHALVHADRHEEARQAYQAAVGKIGKKSPLHPLLTIGIAQTSEALGDFAQASGAYESLKTIAGFGEAAYLGLGRLHELQGEPEKALEVYEAYLATAATAGSFGQRAFVEEKITRIKATL